MAETKLITHKLKQDKKSSQLLATVCRSLLHEFLKHIEVSQLVIKEKDQTFTFGKDSEIKAEIEVHDIGFYTAVLTNGSIGSGESYFRGWWDSPNVTSVVELFAANLPLLDRLEKKLSYLTFPFASINRWLNRNSRSRARKNIIAHYDLGN